MIQVILLKGQTIKLTQYELIPTRIDLILITLI